MERLFAATATVCRPYGGQVRSDRLSTVIPLVSSDRRQRDDMAQLDAPSAQTSRRTTSH